MTTSHHHVGIRVADIERAAAFYEHAFGAVRLTDQPFLVDGEAGETVAAGPKGSAMMILPIGFTGGGGVELFEFRRPSAPTGPTPLWEEGILHFAIQVDDTDATLADFEEAGGERLWPQVMQMDDLRFIYARDPDGNVVEIIDGTMQDIIEVTKKAYFGAEAT